MKWVERSGTTWVLCLGSFAIASVTWHLEGNRRWKTAMLLPGISIKEGMDHHGEERLARTQVERLAQNWLIKAGLIAPSTHLRLPLVVRGDIIEDAHGVAIAKTIDKKTAEALVEAANLGVT